VAEDGTTFIGYAARLTWGMVRFRYRAILVAQPKKAPEERYTLRSSPDPRLDKNGTVSWSCPPLQLTGEWVPQCSSIQRTLFASQAGNVIWECFAPAAIATLTRGSMQMTALGYVERLTMTAPPWSLGLDQLHWGRFIAKDTCLVWIDWRGPKPRRMVWWNGNEAKDAIVHEEYILLPESGTRLELSQCEKSCGCRSRILREGPLVNIISAVPGLTNTLPRWLGQGHESKRITSARLETKGAVARDGWTIHEVVTWN
jgi:hypothetical protein